MTKKSMVLGTHFVMGSIIGMSVVLMLMANSQELFPLDLPVVQGNPSIPQDKPAGAFLGDSQTQQAQDEKGDSSPPQPNTIKMNCCSCTIASKPECIPQHSCATLQPEEKCACSSLGLKEECCVGECVIQKGVRCLSDGDTDYCG